MVCLIIADMCAILFLAIFSSICLNGAIIDRATVKLNEPNIIMRSADKNVNLHN